jgi:hypothetical protein
MRCARGRVLNIAWPGYNPEGQVAGMTCRPLKWLVR